MQPVLAIVYSSYSVNQIRSMCGYKPEEGKRSPLEQDDNALILLDRVSFPIREISLLLIAQVISLVTNTCYDILRTKTNKRFQTITGIENIRR